MKLLTAIAILLTATMASASGKISLQNNLYDDGKTYRPMVGFQVYEMMTKTIGLNSWVGYGVQPLEVKDDVNWLVAKVQADVFMKKFTVSPGLQYKNILSGQGEDDFIPYLKIDYKLW